LNGSRFYNEVVEKYLTDKFGNDFWTKFDAQFDSIVKALTDLQKLTKRKLSYKSLTKIIADTSYSTWAALKDNSASFVRVSHFFSGFFQSCQMQ